MDPVGPDGRGQLDVVIDEQGRPVSLADLQHGTRLVSTALRVGAFAAVLHQPGAAVQRLRHALGKSIARQPVIVGNDIEPVERVRTHFAKLCDS